jgi:hypothetical protein
MQRDANLDIQFRKYAITVRLPIILKRRSDHDNENPPTLLARFALRGTKVPFRRYFRKPVSSPAFPFYGTLGTPGRERIRITLPFATPAHQAKSW